MNKVQGVLVLCPCYGDMPLQTVHTLLNLKEEGAQVLLTHALADVSLSRCIAAGMAERILLAKDSDVDFVLWLDSDVWGNADSVRELGRMILDFERESGRPVSLSGLYLSRHAKRKQVAAHKLRDVDPIPLAGNTGAVLMPALTGLGCFMQTTESFLNHCNESERMCWPDETHTIPIVCQSGIITAASIAKYISKNPTDDIRYWYGEDFDYCAHELDHGRFVFVAPVMFGHSSEAQLTPVGDVMFPGFTPPADDEVTEPVGEPVEA